MFFERKLQDDIENYTPTDVEAPPKEVGRQACTCVHAGLLFLTELSYMYPCSH